MKSRHGLQIEKAVRKTGCIQNDMEQSGQFAFGNGNILLSGEAAWLLAMASERITPALTSGYISGGAILESMRSNVNAIDIYLPTIKVEG